MLKFIMSAFKPIHRHEYVRVLTLHGDLAQHLKGRSLWKCTGCGKTVVSKELTKLVTK